MLEALAGLYPREKPNVPLLPITFELLFKKSVVLSSLIMQPANVVSPFATVELMSEIVLFVPAVPPGIVDVIQGVVYGVVSVSISKSWMVKFVNALGKVNTTLPINSMEGS